MKWDDGRPVANASLRFVPAGNDGREALGYTGKDGNFSLSTFRAGDGALPGDYVVVVTQAAGGGEFEAPPAGATSEDLAKAMKNADKVARQRKSTKIAEPIPQVYQNNTSSPLKWKVEPGTAIRADLKLQKG